METEVIYLDVLICTNLFINYLILLVTAQMGERKTKKTRLFFSAILGSLSSLMILLPPIGFWWEILNRILFAFVMGSIAFPWKCWKIYAKTVFCFFSVSMAFAGIMFAIWMFLAPQSLYISNGVVYFDISALTLVLLSLSSYLILMLFHRIFKIHPMSHKIYEITIQKNEKSISLRGYLDTGNTLRDPFLGIPVAICPLNKIQTIVPEDVLEYYQLVYEKKTGSTATVLVKNRCDARIIPYQTVGGKGLLVAFYPDRFIVFDGKEKKEVEKILIGLTDKEIGSGSYDILLCRDIAI